MPFTIANLDSHVKHIIEDFPQSGNSNIDIHKIKCLPHIVNHIINDPPLDDFSCLDSLEYYVWMYEHDLWFYNDNDNHEKDNIICGLKIILRLLRKSQNELMDEITYYKSILYSNPPWSGFTYNCPNDYMTILIGVIHWSKMIEENNYDQPFDVQYYLQI